MHNIFALFFVVLCCLLTLQNRRLLFFILTALVSLFVFWVCKNKAVSFILLLPLMLKASFDDLETRTVKNETYLLLGLLAMYHAILQQQFLLPIKWGGIAFLLFLLLAALNICPLPGGDMKVICLLCFYFSNLIPILALLIACIAVAVYALVYRIAKPHTKLETVPFIPFITIGLTIGYCVRYAAF